MSDAIIRYVCEGIELFRDPMAILCPLHKQFFLGTGLYEAENIDVAGRVVTVHCWRVGDLEVMGYPTADEVAAADHEQLGRWLRYLHSPGRRWFNTAEFYQKMDEESSILEFIGARFKELGGWTPEVSKAIGWDGA